ncbi:MAG: hypothetical protein AAGA77_21005, partial [Bacteroidota bacterium]
MISFKEINGPKFSKGDNFAELCSMIISSYYPNAKSIDGRGGDKGVDTFIGEFEGHVQIFQHKYYLNKLTSSQKRHIAASLLSACMYHNPYKWILCIPKNLLPSEQKWFQNNLK